MNRLVVCFMLLCVSKSRGYKAGKARIGALQTDRNSHSVAVKDPSNPVISYTGSNGSSNDTMDILWTLDNFLGQKSSLRGEEVDMISDTLLILSCCWIAPDTTYDELINMTQLYAMVLGKLLQQDNMDGWRDSKLGVRALPSLFRSVEAFVHALAVQLLITAEDHSILALRGNIEIGMLVTDPREDLIGMNLTSADVAVDLEDIIRERVVVFILYRNIGKIFPDNVNVQLRQEDLSSVLFGSDILDTAVYSLHDDTENIDNISMTFHLLNGTANGSAICKYWEVDNSSDTGGHWSRDGCNLTERNDSTVSCVCNHLTNFAILVQVVDIVISAANLRVLEIISYVGCSISLLGACLSVMTFTFLRIFKERVLIHLNLALSIIGAQVVFMVEDAVPRHTVGCTVTVILLFYFYMAIFCWMLVEGIQLYLQVIVVFSSENKMKLYYIIGWGLPVVIVAAGVAVVNGNIGQHNVCWLSPTDRSMLAFVIPAMTIVLVNMIILVMVIRVIVRVSSTTGHKKLQHARCAAKASLSLLPILGGTWVFGVLAVSEDLIVFQYLFAITNSIQGFLIFICHCVNSTEVREGFVRHKNNWALSRYLSSQNKVGHSITVNTSNTPPHGLTTVSKTGEMKSRAESVHSDVDEGCCSDSTRSTSMNSTNGSDTDSAKDVGSVLPNSHLS